MVRRHRGDTRRTGLMRHRGDTRRAGLMKGRTNRSRDKYRGVTSHQGLHPATCNLIVTKGGVPEGGGRLGSNYARMCVSKSEGHGFFFSFKSVK